MIKEINWHLFRTLFFPPEKSFFPMCVKIVIILKVLMYLKTSAKNKKPYLVVTCFFLDKHVMAISLDIQDSIAFQFKRSVSSTPYSVLDASYTRSTRLNKCHLKE